MDLSRTIDNFLRFSTSLFLSKQHCFFLNPLAFARCRTDKSTIRFFSRTPVCVVAHKLNADLWDLMLLKCLLIPIRLGDAVHRSGAHVNRVAGIRVL